MKLEMRESINLNGISISTGLTGAQKVSSFAVISKDSLVSNTISFKFVTLYSKRQTRSQISRQIDHTHVIIRAVSQQMVLLHNNAAWKCSFALWSLNMKIS